MTSLVFALFCSFGAAAMFKLAGFGPSEVLGRQTAMQVSSTWSLSFNHVTIETDKPADGEKEGPVGARVGFCPN